MQREFLMAAGGVVISARNIYFFFLILLQSSLLEILCIRCVKTENETTREKEENSKLFLHTFFFLLFSRCCGHFATYTLNLSAYLIDNGECLLGMQRMLYAPLYRI